MEEKHSIDHLLLRVTSQLSIFQKEELRGQLVTYINYLLLHDFNRLVQLLYRIDVSEQKLKKLLQEQPQTDAAVLIANLLIERQVEKLKTRESFRQSGEISDEEKW
jgi:hypothetical protein